MRTRRKTHDEPPHYTDNEVRSHAFRYGWSYHQIAPVYRRRHVYSDYVSLDNAKHVSLWTKYTSLGLAFVSIITLACLTVGFAIIITDRGEALGIVIALLGVLTSTILPVWSERKYL